MTSIPERDAVPSAGVPAPGPVDAGSADRESARSVARPAAPLADRVAMFEAEHARLQAALAEIDHA